MAGEWRPDPWQRHDLRYWDGSGWTEHVADDGVQSTDEPGSESLPPPSPLSAPADGDGLDVGKTLSGLECVAGVRVGAGLKEKKVAKVLDALPLVEGESVSLVVSANRSRGPNAAYLVITNARLMLLDALRSITFTAGPLGLEAVVPYEGSMGSSGVEVQPKSAEAFQVPLPKSEQDLVSQVAQQMLTSIKAVELADAARSSAHSAGEGGRPGLREVLADPSVMVDEQASERDRERRRQKIREKLSSDSGTREDIVEAALELPMVMGVKRELRALPSFLDDGERVEILQSGAYAPTGQEPIEGLIVLTDRRLMCFGKGWTRSGQQSIPIRLITSVSWSSRWGLSELTVTASGTELTISKIPLGQRVADRIRAKMAAPKPPDSQARAETELPGKPTVKQRMSQLKGLLDDGLISEEEYDGKRRELLDEL